ncbi:DoxX family protein, partial [Streptomyces sp. GC420]|uniref:DoxX family protein n=1 Tax=Streptomyces sp. GC420 TaxID=2697568 RepID=UPI001414F676
VPTATTDAPVAAPGRRARIALRALRIVLALFFGVASAAPKLVGHSSAAESFDRIGYGDWFMYAVGGLELVGAVALLIPLLSGPAAVSLIGLMIGAFAYQATVFEGENAATPLVLIVPLALIAWAGRGRAAESANRLRRRWKRPPPGTAAGAGVDGDGRGQ